MKNLNLEKLWELMNTLSEKESELAEHDTYISLLGNRSNFSAYSFEQFLKYYSFKIEDENIIIFNDDFVPYEDYTVGDYSYVPVVLFSFGERDLNEWIENEISDQLRQQELDKEQRKKDLKQQIELIEKQLENLTK